MLNMLNRITWNTRGWRMPTANSADGGFPSETGFGHEEWNFQLEDAIDGYIYGYLYYTKPSAKTMQESNGIFNIGFWSMHPDSRNKYLIGAYQNATIATDDEMQAVYKNFEKRGIIQRRANELVSVLPSMSIEKALEEVKNSLIKSWIKWKCPIGQVVLYDPMIELPSVVNSKVVGAYFAKPTFVDYTTILKTASVKKRNESKTKPKEFMGRTSPLAEDAYFRESAANLRRIIPRHNQLSNLFCKWLESSGIKNVVQEKWNVDISFIYQNKSYLAELKICYGVGTTKAIREAIGQLFEYNYHNQRSPKDVWFIVLDEKPSKSDTTFIETISAKCNLPIHIGWKSGEKVFTFADGWEP